MRFIDLFWWFLDGDKSSSQVVAENKNTTTTKNTTPEPEQPVQELDCYEPESEDMFNGDFDDEYFE